MCNSAHYDQSREDSEILILGELTGILSSIYFEKYFLGQFFYLINSEMLGMLWGAGVLPGYEPLANCMPV